MAKPSGSFSSETVAVVSSLLAVMPAPPSCAESAIVKHPACAAARSSSGLVPTPFSNRVLKEYCVCLRTPLSVEIEPFPSFKPPCQTADALRCMVSLLLALSLFLNLENLIPELIGRVYLENELVEKALSTRMSAVLQEVALRPWPLPSGPWVMAQSWHDLLFAHWPVDAAVLRPLLPPQLQIDIFEGHAWLAVVPFRMTGVRLRVTPPVPWLSAFPELNVRTYVTCGGKPGVWFFSLDAGNSLAVAIARAWFHLPYFRARMSCTERDGWIQYHSERTHRGAPAGLLMGRYRPVDDTFFPHHGTLEYFLTERYCLYTADGRGQIIRVEIHHAPWPLQRAEAEFSRISMSESLEIALISQPLLHFARRQDVLVWPPVRLSASADASTPSAVKSS